MQWLAAFFLLPNQNGLYSVFDAHQRYIDYNELSSLTVQTYIGTTYDFCFGQKSISHLSDPTIHINLATPLFLITQHANLRENLLAQ